MKKIFVAILFLAFASGLKAEVMQVSGSHNGSVVFSPVTPTGGVLSLKTATSFLTNTDTKVTVDQVKGGFEMICKTGSDLNRLQGRNQKGETVPGPVKMTATFVGKDGSYRVIIADPKLYTTGQTYFVHVSQK